MGISFRVIGTGSADSTQVLNVDIGAITGPEAGDTASVFLLPLNYLSTSTDITFNGPNGYSKRMLLNYLVQTQFVSDDCGSRFILSNLDVAEHNFDSVRIINRSPSKAGTVNIQVYRCPNPQRVGISFRQLYATGLLTSQKQSKFIGADINGITSGAGVTLYDGGSTATVRLPVDTATKRSDYTFTFSENKYAPGNRKLGITYETRLDTPYSKCPAKTYITKLRVVEDGKVSTDFDSVSLVINTSSGVRDTLDNLTDPVQTNLYVYRCPETNLFQIAFRQPNASGSTARADTVSIQSITADYTTDVFFPLSNLSYAQLPLDPAKDQTTFTITYASGTVETIVVNYRRVLPTKPLFKACQSSSFFAGLTLGASTLNMRVLQNADSIHYPPISNIELVH